MIEAITITSDFLRPNFFLKKSIEKTIIKGNANRENMILKTNSM